MNKSRRHPFEAPSELSCGNLAGATARAEGQVGLSAGRGCSLPVAPLCSQTGLILSCWSLLPRQNFGLAKRQARQISLMHASEWPGFARLLVGEQNYVKYL